MDSETGYAVKRVDHRPKKEGHLNDSECFSVTM